MLQHLPTSLPGEGPRRDDGDLSDEEDGTRDDRLAQVHAHSHRRRYVLALDENGVLARRTAVRRFAVVLETELVRDLNRLNQKEILAALGRGTGRTTTTTFAVGNDGSKLAGQFFLVALYRLASWHAGCHQGAELNHLGTGELEGVEVRQEDLKREENVPFFNISTFV